jgi:pyruvyl transferase EpsI
MALNEKIVRDIVGRYRQNPIIIMPQTVYFSDTVQGREELKKSKEVFYQHKNLTLFVRDKKSYNFVVDTGYIRNVIYVPDIALYGFLDQVPRGQRHGCLLCFRKDREKKQETYDVIQLAHSLASNSVDVTWTTTVYLDGINPSSRKSRLYQKLSEYASAEFVITDRLHSMIFAALTGTPCIAVDNLTQKVSGVYEWISDLTYVRVVQSIEDVLSVIDNIGINDSHTFPSTLLSELFLKIENVIREKSDVIIESGGK